MNNCLRRLSRLVLALIVGIVALGSVGEIYAQNRVTFSLQNRRAVGTTYYAELWASVASGQTWHVGGTTVNVYFNEAALTPQDQSAVFDAHPDLHNSSTYSAMTQGPYSVEGTAITITNLSISNFSNQTGSFKIGTFTWTIANPSAFDDLVIVVPPDAGASVVLDSNNTLGYDCGDMSCFGAIQPVSRMIGLPEITVQPGSITTCAGQAAIFTVTATGSSLTYEWQYSTTTTGTFTTISGQAGATLTLDPVTTADAGAYRVVVSTTTGSVTSNVVTLEVNTTPVISTEPVDFTACATGDATFTVGFTSTTPATIQWQVFDDISSNFVNLAGETSATLTITNVEASESGSQYRAELTNTCGVSTTNVATLNVNTAPVVNLDPINEMACSGANVTFTANANGTPAPTAQWQVSTDGTIFTDLAGETSATLTLVNIQSSQNNNQYRAVFTNSCGVATTATAMLTVNTMPVVSTTPGSQTACEGTTVVFNAAANGTPTPTIQWEISTDGGNNFTALSGETGGSLTVANITASQNGNQYRAVFTNVCGTVASAGAMLSVNTAPVVTTDPVDQTVCVGGSVTFTAAATSTPTPTVQWQVNDGSGYVDITGETSPTMTVSSVTFAQNGFTYRAVFTNVCGTAMSADAFLTVNRAPQTASVTPTSQTVCSGNQVVFTATSTGGTPTPTVQWQSRPNSAGTFTNISGATELSLIFSPTVAENGSEYRAIFTNECGSMTSNTVTLTVTAVATVTTQPAPQTQCVGGTVMFTATATGSPSPTIQWEVSTNGGGVYTPLADGGNISGAQTTTLTLSNVAANQTNNLYRAAFSNTCGTVTSNGALLTVNVPPTVTTNPVSRDTCAGSTVTFTAAATATPAATIQWQVMTTSAGTWADLGGETGPTLTLTNITLDQSGNMYRALFTNACGTTATAAATLTINLGPSVAVNPADQTVCEGVSVTFTSQAIGSPTPTVQWEVSSNGGSSFTAIAGATSPSFTISSPTFGENGFLYRAVYSNVCGSVASDAAILTVNTVPVVTVDPVNQTVCAGGNATFTAQASGSPAPSVQWEVSIGGGAFTPIFGANSTTYTFVAGPNDNGNIYRAVFTNACGTDISAEAMLNFYALPAITQQPTAVAVCEGNSFTLSVGAIGTGLTYQWRREGIDIPGANASTYTVAAATAGDAGFYTVVVSNICNQPVESNPVNVSVSANPVITVQPVPATVCEGQFAQFFVQATGTGLSFQWRRNNVDIPGATNTFYNIPAAQLSDAGSYTVAVTGACGTPVISDAAQLTVETAPVITQQPTNVTVCVGEAATFTVAANGSNLTYEWQFNGQPVGAGATLTLSDVTAADAGSYRVIVTGSCGLPVSSATVTLTVNESAVIVSDVQNQTVCEGQNATFTVNATGTGLSYQWTFNGSPIPGANGPSLTVNNATINSAGDYQVTITGLCPTGEPVMSRVATLTVWNNVVITVQPQSVSTCLGFNFLLSVSASGTGFPGEGLRYQWYKDGQPIPTGTGSQLTFFNAQYSMSGNYTVAVTGLCGTVVSNTAVVVVNRPTSAVLRDRDIQAAFGDTVIFEVSDVSGSGTTFQWFKDGIPLADIPGEIFGSQSSKLFLFNVDAGDASNNYHVVVDGPCGPATSEFASLNLFNPEVQFTELPTDMTICENAGFTLSATAQTNVEGGVITYQWFLNGVAIAGATQRTYTVTTATAGQFTYRVEATETTKGITITSGNAIVDVFTAPNITLQPVSGSFCENDLTSLTVGVNPEAGPVTYQWFKDGLPIDPALNETATTATLVGPVMALTVGNYAVVVANACGSATSTEATVSMKAPTVIVQQPPATVILDTLGVSELRLTVVATGENCAYQWQRNGVDIAGATSSEFVLTSPTEADLGDYTVVITCECGTTTSTVAAFTGFTTDVEGPVAGEGFYLFQNHPNPFTGLTSIRYQVPTATDVHISITDMYGREVAVLVNGVVAAGQHEAKFDAAQLPSGTYFYTMTASGFKTSRRMMHIK